MKQRWRILLLCFLLGIGISVQAATVKPKAIDFIAYDQNMKLHHLEEYKGKVVFMTFWLTWCPHCLKELDDLEEVYYKHNKNQEDVVILTIADPKSEEYPKNRDITTEEILKFLEEKKYTFPVIFDTAHQMHQVYQASKAPTAVFINPTGEIEAVIVGSLTKKQMEQLIQGTKEYRTQEILLKIAEEQKKKE